VVLAIGLGSALVGCPRDDSSAASPSSGASTVPSATGSDDDEPGPRDSDQHADRAAGDEAAGQEDRATAAGDPLTGVLSEDAFAALHTHRGDDAPPLEGETIRLEDGSSAYLSVPTGEAPHPGVLVIHEWWGLNDHIRHWSDRLAADGYAALAVDLYGGEVATEPQAAMALVRSVDQDEAIRTLRAGHRRLEADPRVRAPRTASIGWCFGGGWSLRAGLAVDGLDGTVVYYGQPIVDADRLDDLGGPLLGIFGTEDRSIPSAKVDAFDQALDQAGVTHRILRFEADHAFANPSSGRYDAEAAEEAWRQVRDFLEGTLKSPS